MFKTTQAEDNRQPSARKSGPGRRHEQGHKTGSKRRNKAATKPVGFFDGQHTNPAKNVERKARKAAHDSGQHSKLIEARTRKQHVHPLRDDIGALTLTGGTVELIGCTPKEAGLNLYVTHTSHQFGGGPLDVVRSGRRVWLAGISAQRGY